MAYHDEQPAEIAHDVRHHHVGARKHAVAEDEIHRQHGEAALERVAEKVDDAHFKPEGAHHVHRARVAAAYVAYVAVFELRDYHRKVETADKVAHRGGYYEVIPLFGNIEINHCTPLAAPCAQLSSFLSRVTILIGVPEKSNAARRVFSKKRL